MQLVSWWAFHAGAGSLLLSWVTSWGKEGSLTPIPRQDVWGGRAASLKPSWVGSPANCFSLLALIYKMAIFSNTELTKLLVKVNKTILSTVLVQSGFLITDYILFMQPPLHGLLVT